MRKLILILTGLLFFAIFFESLKSGLAKLSTTITNSSATKLTAATKKPPVQEQRPTIVYQNQQNKEQTEETSSLVKIPASDHMSTPNELFTAVNAYRQRLSLRPLNTNQFLCEVAQKRADEQLAKGELDHSGFSKYTEEQQEFSLMGEILFTSPYPQSGAHIVEMGWDKSKTGHREEMQNASYSHGCAGINGHYAVFVFGG